MIELRRVERAVKPEHEGATGYYEVIWQYRQTETIISGMTGKPVERMSEWREVPTVREDG